MKQKTVEEKKAAWDKRKKNPLLHFIVGLLVITLVLTVAVAPGVLAWHWTFFGVDTGGWIFVRILTAYAALIALGLLIAGSLSLGKEILEGV